jgi:hypothetical protein
VVVGVPASVANAYGLASCNGRNARSSGHATGGRFQSRWVASSRSRTPTQYDTAASWRKRKEFSLVLPRVPPLPALCAIVWGVSINRCPALTLAWSGSTAAVRHRGGRGRDDRISGGSGQRQHGGGAGAIMSTIDRKASPSGAACLQIGKGNPQVRRKRSSRARAVRFRSSSPRNIGRSGLRRCCQAHRQSLSTSPSALSGFEGRDDRCPPRIIRITFSRATLITPVDRARGHIARAVIALVTIRNDSGRSSMAAIRRSPVEAVVNCQTVG